MTSNKYVIHVDYDPPPIPVRHLDWVAYFDDYEPGAGCVGYGPTEYDAIVDLLQTKGI